MPFTIVGDEVTIGSLVGKLQIWLHTNCPQDPARHARTSPFIFPAYTTPLATVGDERMSACVPVPKSSQRGSQFGWPQPDALNTPTLNSRPMYTLPLKTAGD